MKNMPLQNPPLAPKHSGLSFTDQIVLATLGVLAFSVGFPAVLYLLGCRVGVVIYPLILLSWLVLAGGGTMMGLALADAVTGKSARSRGLRAYQALLALAGLSVMAYMATTLTEHAPFWRILSASEVQGTSAPVSGSVTPRVWMWVGLGAVVLAAGGARHWLKKPRTEG